MPPSRGVSEFVSEAQEIVDALYKDLLALDKVRDAEPDPDLVNRIFRSAHSLKGIAAMFGAAKLAGLAHALEDLLDAVRLGKAALDGGVIDALLESVDVLQRMIQEVAAGDRAPAKKGSADTAAAVVDRIRAAKVARPKLAREAPAADLGLDEAALKVLTEYEEHRLRENVRKGARLLRVRAEFDIADFDTKLAELNGRLKPLGEIIATLPSSTPSGPSRIAFDLLFGTAEPPERISRAVEELTASVSSAGEVVQPARAAPPPGPAPEKGRPSSLEPETTLRSATQTVRVDIRKLDGLMNIVGELSLARANVQRVADTLRASFEATSPAPDRAMMGLVGELAREGRSLERRINDLQAGILEVRMVPLGQVFDKLARLVRKVARDADKDIDFRVSGGEVELDKLIVEELSDPLMHLVRNAVDHGIESAEVRSERGKTRRGVIALSGLQKGNHVVIEVSDDGAGVDEARIRQIAVAKGLVTAEVVEALSRRDVMDFLFLPGFSTAREVSELSGRGVGLDVVKTNIANLSGIIDVKSELGVGTTMSITLPVTLAIIRALLVSVAGRTYAVPLNSVLEIAEVVPSQLRSVSGREVVDLRGSTLPLVRLARMFGYAAEPGAHKQQVVVVGLAQERLGMAVDDLLGQQDIVIKSLGKMLPPVRGIAGATDLGHRRTVLVLDVGAVIAEVLHGAAEMPEARAG